MTVSGLHTTSTGITNTTYGSTHMPRYYLNLFTELASMFELPNIDANQLELLNELYDSNDESNKKIAVEIFKYLMKSNDNTTQPNNTADNS